MKTLNEAVEAFKLGMLIAVAEYRSSRAESIQWRDKETHMIMRGTTLTHAIELNGVTAMVSERVPDDFDTKNYKSPFNRGEQVLVNVQMISRNKGITTIYGTLEAMAVNGKPAPAAVAK